MKSAWKTEMTDSRRTSRGRGPVPGRCTAVEIHCSKPTAKLLFCMNSTLKWAQEAMLVCDRMVHDVCSLLLL